MRIPLALGVSCVGSTSDPSQSFPARRDPRHGPTTFLCPFCLVDPCRGFPRPRGTATAGTGPLPADNPLKGLVPYARPTPGRFPHSMEFGYLPLSGMMRGPDEFDWQPLESLLDDIASRGNQTVFRVYLEYPGKKEGIPEFLIRGGLKVHLYKNTNTAPLPPAESRTPEYSNPQLRKALRSFIAALGAKYDGDPRIAYITAGCWAPGASGTPIPAKTCGPKSRCRPRFLTPTPPHSDRRRSC